MKTTSAVLLLGLLGIASASAKVNYKPEDIKIPAYEIKYNGNGQMQLEMVVDASALPLKSNQEAVIVPTIKSGSMVSTFAPIYISGRNRMIYHERNNQVQPNMYRNGKSASNIVYSSTIPYQAWMDQADVNLDILWQGCANCATGNEAVQNLANVKMVQEVFDEQLVFLPAEAENVKIREVTGTAYIDYVVGKSQILPDFRNNAAELAKIDKSISAVKDNKDITINEIAIKGSASPEGPYQLNLNLSKSRTLALADYVKKLYNFPSSVKFATSWIGEDWTGLRQKVENMEIAEKSKILALIDNTSLTDDQKDLRIKKDFPQEYAYLLKNVYPSLRYSDYKITYTVKKYSDVNEILAVMKTSPQNLSLNEFYLASQSLEPGSDAYNEVFETAVRMFPDDPVANFNAASAAIGKGDYKAAEKYLAKAPKGNQADYLRGVMAAKQGDYKTAQRYFSQIKGMPEATEALESVTAIISGPSGNLRVTDKR